MAGVGPNKRPTALIFQNLALFPLMSVAENIGYGLRVRGVSAKERAARPTNCCARRLAGHRRQADQRTLGRAETARGDRARARGRAAGAVARRAAVGAGPATAAAHARGVAGDPAARRHHLHLHHPRPGRGADHVRSGRGDERTASSSRSATAARSTTIPRRRSSPRSSARTMASPAGADARRRARRDRDAARAAQRPRRRRPCAGRGGDACSSGPKACVSRAQASTARVTAEVGSASRATSPMSPARRRRPASSPCRSGATSARMIWRPGGRIGVAYRDRDRRHRAPGQLADDQRLHGIR